MTEEGVALFLPSLSLPSISFVSLLQACIYIYTHTYIPKCPSFSRLVSFHSCRFTKCSHFKQYPGYSCTLVRRRRTRIREREHRPTVPPPSQQPPWPHPPPFIRLCPPSRINRPSLHGGFSLVNLQPLPFLPSRQGWKNSFLFDTPRNIGSNERALTPSSPASCVSLHPWQG